MLFERSSVPWWSATTSCTFITYILCGLNTQHYLLTCIKEECSLILLVRHWVNECSDGSKWCRRRSNDCLDISICLCAGLAVLSWINRLTLNSRCSPCWECNCFPTGLHRVVILGPVSVSPAIFRSISLLNSMPVLNGRDTTIESSSLKNYFRTFFVSIEVRIFNYCLFLTYP